jgi:hypothetical protein
MGSRPSSTSYVSEQGGPKGHAMEQLTLTEQDIELIRQSRSRDRYADFSDAEKGAHSHVHEVLGQLGALAVEELGGTRDYSLKLTSGFHPKSGVRGAKPKDLWFGVYRKENEEPFLANPQIFMVVSQRGVEWGFSPLTHPDDFSNQAIKKRTRQIARDVLVGIRRIPTFRIFKHERAQRRLTLEQVIPPIAGVFVQGAKRFVVSSRLACLKQIERASGCALTVIKVAELHRNVGCSLFSNV